MQRCAGDDRAAGGHLQTAWWSACLSGLLFIAAGFGWLCVVWQPMAAFQWMLQTAGVSICLLWMLRIGLGKNAAWQDSASHDAFGLANWLTVGRGFLIAALGGFLFQPPPGSEAGSNWLIWVPGAIYVIAALMDYLDGFLARAMRSETRLGKWLDTQIDALGLFVAPVLAIAYNRLPFYYISVGLAFYLFRFGIWYRKKNNRRVIEIKPHPVKRMIAGFQMGLVAVSLLPVFSQPALTVAATIFMVPLLAGFIRDALVSGGYVQVNHLQQSPWDRRIGFVSTRLLPVFLRLIICATVIFVIYDAAVAHVAGKHSAIVAALDASMPLGLPALPLLAAGGLLIAVGFMARSMALLMGFQMAGALPGWESPLSLFVLLSGALALMLTGSGVRSPWQPEDKLLMERRGQSSRL